MLPVPRFHEVAVSIRQVLVALTGEVHRDWPPMDTATVLGPRLLLARLALTEALVIGLGRVHVILGGHLVQGAWTIVGRE